MASFPGCLFGWVNTGVDVVDRSRQMFLYVTQARREDRLQGELVGDGCDAIPTDRLASFKFVQLDFVRPLFNNQIAVEELAKMAVPSVLAQLVLNPVAIQCRNPQDVLVAADLYEDDGGVPLNEFQFDAISRIGTDRIILIQGPPGTGKSSTIWNAVRYVTTINSPARFRATPLSG